MGLSLLALVLSLAGAEGGARVWLRIRGEPFDQGAHQRELEVLRYGVSAFKQPQQLMNWLAKTVRNGGGTRTRTGDDGFAIRCLSHLAMPPLDRSGLRLREDTRLWSKVKPARGFQRGSVAVAQFERSECSTPDARHRDHVQPTVFIVGQ